MRKSLIRKTCAWIALIGAPYAIGQGSPDRRLLEASEAEQTAFIKSALDQGMPSGLGDRMTVLLRNKGSLVLPILEAKIEQVLGSNNPQECFTDNSVDPHRFVDRVAWAIANVGDDEALKQVAKLIKLDEKRFGMLVGITLGNARDWHNPFTVGYHGFAMGDPAIDQKIKAWAAEQLGSHEESTVTDAERRWADALVDKYGGPPTGAQWADDPFVSGLKPSLAESMHNDVFRKAVDALVKRTPK